MKISRLSLLLLAATASVSCFQAGESLGFDQFSVSLGPGSATVVQGGATTTTLTINRASGYDEVIVFSATGQPSGVDVDIVENGTSTAAAVTITVGNTVPVNVYPIVITGREGGEIETATFSLTVSQGSNFTITVSPPVLFLTQGSSSSPITVNIVRNNFTGPVTVSVGGFTGVSAALSSPNPQTGNSVAVTLTASLGAAVGSQTGTITATGAGAIPTSAETQLTVSVTELVVSGNFTLNTTSPVSVVQGGSVPVTVNIPRTGGNTSNVALSATFTGTPPTEMTLSFLPTSTTSTSSVLTVATTANTPAGSYPIVIRGNVPGLAEQTTNLTVNVTAPAPVNVTVSFASCTAGNKAVWLAYSDGSTATWTAVTGVGDVYTFPIAQAKGSFAYVTIPFAAARIFVQHMTQAELSAGTLTPCVAAAVPGSALQGTLINLPAGSEAVIDFGGASALASANGNFQLNNTPPGTFDLIGFSRNSTTGAATRAFIQRAITPPAGTFSVTVDFAHATRSDNAVAGAGTVTGLTGTETELYNNMTYRTAASACGTSLLYTAVSSPAGFPFYGMPASLRAIDDIHSLQLTVIDGAGSSRSLTESFVDVALRAAAGPFLLPPPLPSTTASDAGGPYKRPTVAVAGAISSAYNVSHTLFYADNSGSGKQGTISATSGWVGGANLTLGLPNFAGVGVFLNAWAPAAEALNWNLRSVGGVAATSCAAGQRSVSATRTGTL